MSSSSDFALQWGRTFSSAERTAERTPNRKRRLSFNGAALFQVRKVEEGYQAFTEANLASMGPHFFKCGKMPACQSALPILLRFNGAALFQVRKVEIAANQRPLDNQCFNGAALFQVRKVKTACSATLLEFCFNGAALFQVRKVSGRQENRQTEIGFNGAALFQVRKASGQPISIPELAKLQWGRTFSSAERTVISNARMA